MPLPLSLSLLLALALALALTLALAWSGRKNGAMGGGGLHGQQGGRDAIAQKSVELLHFNRLNAPPSRRLLLELDGNELDVVGKPQAARHGHKEGLVQRRRLHRSDERLCCVWVANHLGVARVVLFVAHDIAAVVAATAAAVAFPFLSRLPLLRLLQSFAQLLGATTSWTKRRRRTMAEPRLCRLAEQPQIGPC
jgi:hypothetical protein